MDSLPSLNLVDGASTVALLVFLVVAFVRDMIVSGKRHREDMAQERLEKREALDMVKAYGSTLEKLLTHAETTNAILRSLPHPSTRGRAPDGDDPL